MTDELRPLSPQTPLLPQLPAEAKVSVVHTELFIMGYKHGTSFAPLALVSTQYIRGWVSGYLDHRYSALSRVA